ncbi:potassium channel family protein [Scrofimicrobium sp. R131]|uniref:potassium channel family protein n=1 Tax=Scrofimicrobium appendicitidis TaxID=3079930 RepID=UPI003305E3D0
MTFRSALEQKLDDWTKFTVWPMFVLSVCFVAVTALVISPPADLDGHLRAQLATVSIILWVIFALEFLVRLVAAPDRRRFLQHQSFELVTLMVPYLRPFLLIRYLWQLHYFRHRGAGGMRQRAIISISLFALFFVYTASTLVWIAERNAPKANILNWGDAIWWGFTTMSTVGYGDFYPVTVLGRLVAIMLMIGGLFVVGVTSAIIISAFNTTIESYLSQHSPEDSDETRAHRGKALMEALSLGALHDDDRSP